MSVKQHTRITICPRHRPLLGRFYRAPKSCQVTSLAGKHVINSQMTVEICFHFRKLSDRVSVIFFAGFGYFFLNRELLPIVRLHICILLHFTFEFSGGAIPIPRPKICFNSPILGPYGAIKRPFSSSILKKKTFIRLEFTKFGNAILT